MAEGVVVATVLTGAAACLTGWAALVRARHLGTEECEENLAISRAEAEAGRAEVHRLRMLHPEDVPPDPDAGAISPGFLYLVAVILIAATVVLAVVGVRSAPGPAGPAGPPATFACPTGFSPERVTVDKGAGGVVTLFVCAG